MSEKNQFHIADVVVFIVTIIISIGIGLFYAFSGGKQKTTSEYLVGGRIVSFLPVAISLMVSFESSIMMLGLPAEGYVYGIQYIIGALGFLVSQILSVYVVVPLLHPLKITSAYEYLEYRFQSKAVRLLGTAMGMLTYCMYMGIVLFGPAVALEAVTGFPMWTSIFTISLVAVIYTSIGGLKAVIWTDVFQAFVMFAGIFAVLIRGTIDVGGPKAVWDIADKGGRLNFFEFDLDPRTRHTFFNLFFTAVIRGFGLAFNQSTVQRISATKSVGEAKKVLYLVAPAFSGSLALALYEGIVAYAYYNTKQCDPFKSGQLTNPNQIMPLFVMDIFHDLPGMPGLFLAALFAASLSTLSSGLSSMSAMFWTDIARPLLGDISDLKGTIIAKVSVLCFGAMACGLAFIVSLIGGTLIQITGSLLAAFGGPATGLFLLGCFTHRTTAKGAFIGGFLGLAISSWLSFSISFSPDVKRTPWLSPASTDMCPGELAKNMSLTTYTPNNITISTTVPTTTTPTEKEPGSGFLEVYNMSYTFIAPIGILSTIIFGYISSLILGANKPGDVDPRYLLSFSEFIFKPFPASFQKWVSSFGAQFMKEEYKDKFPDPALKDATLHKEVVSAPHYQSGEKEELLEKSDIRDTNGNSQQHFPVTILINNKGKNYIIHAHSTQTSEDTNIENADLEQTSALNNNNTNEHRL